MQGTSIVAGGHTSAKVYLVGAGPGDPGLITVRAAALLEQADVVVYDYLANPQLLTHCPRAQKIYVGKQASRHSMTQREINQLLVKEARLGKRVVRLKGGDPYVFGRGAEEALALVEAGIAFEVVPGITAAIGGPAYAGIPVTHRDFNSSFTLVTGHEKEADYQDADARGRGAGAASDVDWSVLAKLPCVAFYMGVKSLGRICGALIEHGMSEQMPAAVIQWATTPRQRAAAGTLADLPAKAQEAGIAPPALIIVGRVVELRGALNWFENRPLFGKTVIVTRTRQQASGLSAQLAELGAHVLEAPTIELAAGDGPAVDQSLREAGGFDWVIFTSANGVEFARRRLDEMALDSRVFGAAKLAAIGDATADAIRRELSLRVDLCPSRFVAEALAEELLRRGEVAKKRFLMLRADIARPILRQQLEGAGAAQVRDVAIYQTRAARELPPHVVDMIDQRKVDWVTFTSSSTARNFAQLLGPDYAARLAGVKLASIGPVTTATLKELGLSPAVEARTFNTQGLVEAIAR
jgi:uroporphyrinogen III methyltransferase/synthase